MKKPITNKIKFRETTKGLVIVYTGEGKGKTTAALGLALRAAGYKRRVLIIQFGKIWFTGELEGVKKLAPISDSYPIMPDPIVAMTYITAAIVTGSQVTIKNCPLEFLELELLKLEVMGQKFNLKNKRLSANGLFDIVDIELHPSSLVAAPDKLECRPFPGLNIDNLPLFIPIVATASGRTLIHDWVYEDRALYSLELKKLGVAITLIDIHRVWVEGPTDFKPNEVICPSGIRPAVNVLLCMLGAKGKSILRNTYVIERGYENLYETLNKAGADIEVVSE